MEQKSYIRFIELTLFLFLYFYVLPTIFVFFFSMLLYFSDFN